MHIYPSLKKFFLLVLPFLWKDKTARVATILTVGLTGMHTLAHTIAPWLLGNLIKQYAQLDIITLLLTGTLLLCCWYAGEVLHHFRAIAFFPVINHAIRDIRMRVIMHLHQSPIQSWKSYGITEILSANTRVSQSLRNFMHISFIKVFPSLINIGAFSMAMWHVHHSTWYFTPLVLLTYSYVYLGMRDSLKLRRYGWEATDRANTAMSDSLHNTQFFRFHLQEAKKRLSTYVDAEQQGWWHHNLLLHKIPIFQITCCAIVRGGLIIHLLRLLQANMIAWADFIVIERYTALTCKQVVGITRQLQNWLSSVVDFQKVLDLLALHTDTVAPEVLTQPTYIPTTPMLQMRHVSFAHTPHHKNILQDCSISIHKGDKIAITGPSGVGKSTLCHLLVGMYQPQQGEILLRGVPLKQLSLAVIGQNIQLINQEAGLFRGTIAENLMIDTTQALSWDDYFKDRLSHAADRTLSSGEQQRIFLARCLRFQPKLLILDETLSALDEQSSQTLLKNILKIVPTVILVTHRLSLVQDFCHIYHMESGKLKAA